jgi:hypothetical protein
MNSFPKQSFPFIYYCVGEQWHLPSEADNTWQHFLSMVAFANIFFTLDIVPVVKISNPLFVAQQHVALQSSCREPIFGSGNTFLVEEAVTWDVPGISISSVLLKICFSYT